MSFLKKFLTDLATLKLPVTAAAVVATGLALVEPFGLVLDDGATAKVTAALVAVGLIAEWLKRP